LLSNNVTDKTIILPSNSSGNGDNAQYRLTVMVPKRQYLAYLQERWWVVMICVALALSAAIAYETVRSETYSSFAQLYASGEVRFDVANVFSDEEAQTYYGTQIQLLKSDRLQSAAFSDIGYTPRPDSPTPVKLDVIQPMNTAILVLQATGPDPSLAQRFLQALITEYLAYKKEMRMSSSEEIALSLTGQLAKTKDDLAAEQEKWTAFQRTNNMALLDEESGSVGKFVADENVELDNLKLQGQLLQRGLAPAGTATSANTEQNSTDAGTAGGTEGRFAALSSADQSVKAARVSLMLAETQLAHVMTNGPEYQIKPLKDQVERIQQNLAALQAVDAAERQTELQEIEARVAAISNAIPEWQAKVAEVNNRLADSKQLEAAVQRQQGYYDQLLELLQNVDLSRNVQPERVSILQPATQAAPVGRHLGVVAALAMIFGVFLGLGIVFVWYVLDDRFVSVRDIKDQFGETVLGLVPQIKVHRAKPQQALLQPNDPRQVYAESYRHLRSALLLSSLAESRPQTLLFTGVAPAEGKTTIAVNLARVLARGGMRVVLVDADAHGGGMQRVLGGEPQPGVLDYLRGNTGAEAIMRSTDISGLEYVPAGTLGEDAEGLFLSPRLKELMSELRTGRDFVILDGAPILTADDAALLVPYANAVILVLRPFYSRSRMVRQALDMLYHRQARQVTIILNRARKDDLAGQYYSRNGRARTAGKPAPARA
jgi:capsular exopolysaccharide synthesis family protein